VCRGRGFGFGHGVSGEKKKKGGKGWEEVNDVIVGRGGLTDRQEVVFAHTVTVS
jgi:hypothetical protein